MRKLFLIAAFAVLLCSCSKRAYVPVERISQRSDTLTALALRVDTLLERDSVVVSIKGDTVFKEAWRTRYRTRRLVDTVYRSRRDTVKVEVPVEVSAPAQTTKKTSLLNRIAGAARSALFIFAALAAALLLLKISIKSRSK